MLGKSAFIIAGIGSQWRLRRHILREISFLASKSTIYSAVSSSWDGFAGESKLSILCWNKDTSICSENMSIGIGTNTGSGLPEQTSLKGLIQDLGEALLGNPPARLA